jgi:hypothetical protein
MRLNLAFNDYHLENYQAILRKYSPRLKFVSLVTEIIFSQL